MIELDALDQESNTDHRNEHIDAIREQINEAFQITQNLTFDLCPPELYQVGLESAILELTIRIQKQHGIDIAFDDDGQSKLLSDDTRYFLFRSTRELLLNIVKHAHATAVRVSIIKDVSNIQIQVSDDGEGFESSNESIYKKKHVSFGLFSIRERLHQIGGALNIASEPGRGTHVKIIVPMNNRNECGDERKA